jgi:hypothetical protein
MDGESEGLGSFGNGTSSGPTSIDSDGPVDLLVPDGSGADERSGSAEQMDGQEQLLSREQLDQLEGDARAFVILAVNDPNNENYDEGLATLISEYQDAEAKDKALGENKNTDLKTNHYRKEGDPEGTFPHDASDMNYAMLQVLEKKSPTDPEAEKHFKTLIKHFSARVLAADGKTYALAYVDYKKWVAENHSKGTTDIIHDVSNVKFSSCENVANISVPAQSDESDSLPESEITTETLTKRAQETITFYREVIAAYKDQDAFVREIIKYYPEVESKGTLTQDQLAKVAARDNERTKRVIQMQLDQDESLKKDQVRTKLAQKELDRIAAEEQLLKGNLNESEIERVASEFNPGGILSTPEARAQYLELHYLANQNKEEFTKKMGEKFKEVKKDQISKFLKGGSIGAAVLGFIVLSSLLGGEERA